jgi:hypothetical protein
VLTYKCAICVLNYCRKEYNQENKKPSFGEMSSQPESSGNENGVGDINLMDAKENRDTVNPAGAPIEVRATENEVLMHINKESERKCEGSKRILSAIDDTESYENKGLLYSPDNLNRSNLSTHVTCCNSDHFNTAGDPVVSLEHEEYQYLNHIDRIIKNGFRKSDRTGVGTYSLFGAQMRYSLRNGKSEKL